MPSVPALWSSIRVRAAVLTSVLVALVLASFIAYALRQVSADVLARASERSESAGSTLAAQTGQNVQRGYKALQDAANDAAYRDLLDKPTPASRQRAQERLNQPAPGPQPPTAEQRTEVWDTGGHRLLEHVGAGTNEASLPPSVPPGEPGIQPLVRHGDRVFSRAVAAIVAHGDAGDDNRLLGYYVTMRPLSATPSATALISGIVGGNARTLIGNRAGDVWTDLSRPIPSPPDLDHPGAREFMGADGQVLVGSPVPIAGSPYLMVVALPRAIVLAPVSRLMWRLVIAGVAFTILATAVAAAFSRRVTTPLAELTAAAQSIAAGDYASRARIGGRDEIGRLAATFNAMAEQVEEQRARLESDAKALAVSREDARQANHAKDEFLAVLSHELRTPLNAMLGWCHLLGAGMVQPERMGHALEVIERNARTQLRLVEDLLDVSRIVAGKFALELSPIDPAVVVRAAVESIRPSAAAKGIVVRANFDGAAGAIRGDAGRLQQAVGNLLSNAVKFTPAGGSVEVTVTRRGDDVEVVVADSGEGIEAAALPVIFDRLRQADRHARRQGGLGLGLAIVRQIVQLHGGSVEAQSDGRGRGARFRVRLPVMSAAAADALRGPRPEAAHDLHGVTCLVVEDSDDSRELVTDVLRSRGAEVTAVSGAEEALSSLARGVPDLLISDLEMPEQSGFDLIERVRSWPEDRGGRVPAIALTAYAAPEDRERSLAAGFDAHIAKPVDIAELTAAVARLAGSRPARPHARG